MSFPNSFWRFWNSFLKLIRLKGTNGSTADVKGGAGGPWHKAGIAIAKLSPLDARIKGSSLYKGEVLSNHVLIP